MTVVGKIRNFLALERNVLVMALTFGIMNLTQSMWMQFLALYITDELKATTFEMGLAYTVQGLSYIVISVPFGYLADTVGRKKLIVPGTFLIALAIMSYAYVPNWQLLMAMMAIFTMVHAAYFGALESIVADSVSPERRATAFASTMFIAGFFSMPGPIIGGYLHSVLKTWRPLFIISGLTTLVMAVSRAIFLKETIETKAKLESPIKYSLTRFRKEFYGDFKEILLGERSRSGFFLSSCIGSLAGSFLGFGMMGGGAFLVKYAQDVIGLTEFHIGVWGTATSTAWFLFQIIGGKLADRFGRKPVMIASGLVWFPEAIGFLYSRNLLQVLIVQIPPLMAHAGSSSAYLALLSELVEKEKRATTISISTALGSIFGFPGPAIGGFLYGTMSPQSPFYTNLILSIPALLVLIFLVKEPKRSS